MFVIPSIDLMAGEVVRFALGQSDGKEGVQQGPDGDGQAVGEGGWEGSAFGGFGRGV